MGFAHFRLGHIYRLLDDRRAGRRGIPGVHRALRRPGQAAALGRGVQAALASSYNWLAETLRPIAENYSEAETLYGQALSLQRELVQSAPDDPVSWQELARTRYNRGILYATAESSDASLVTRAEADFREAIALLEALAAKGGGGQVSQELARSYNNLAALLSRNDEGITEAKRPLRPRHRASRGAGGEGASKPGYKSELAKFSNNYAELLRERGELAPARERNDRAIGADRRPAAARAVAGDRAGRRPQPSRAHPRSHRARMRRRRRTGARWTSTRRS